MRVKREKNYRFAEYEVVLEVPWSKYVNVYQILSLYEEIEWFVLFWLVYLELFNISLDEFVFADDNNWAIESMESVFLESSFEII